MPGAAAPGEGEKRKPGRPKGSGSGSGKKAAADDDYAQATALVQGAFGIMAARLGPEWNVTTDEAALIAGPGQRILADLLPVELVNKYGDWAALLTGLGMVVGPRLMIYLTKPKEAAQNEQPGSGGSRPVPKPDRSSEGTQPQSHGGSSVRDALAPIG